MRIRLGLLLTTVLALLAGSVPAQAIIIGGSGTTVSAFPFMASVHQDGLFLCSGTVIAPRWVLTAAHCVEGSGYAVRVGSTSRSSGGALIAVDSAIAHPDFNGSTFANDAGLLHLVSDAPVAPVTLAGSGDDNLEADGAPATLVGWGDITPTLGLLAPDGMRRAQVNIVSDEFCFGETDSIAARTTVCDTGFLQGQCNGDSGGAQLSATSGGYRQIGIISNSTILLCGYANPLLPEASAEVNAPSIRSWISAIAGV